MIMLAEIGFDAIALQEHQKSIEQKEPEEIEKNIDFKVMQVELELVRRLYLETGESIRDLINRYVNIVEFAGHTIRIKKDGMDRERKIKDKFVDALENFETVGVESEDWTERAMELVNGIYRELEDTREESEVKVEQPQLGMFVYFVKEATSEDAKHYQIEEGARYLELHVQYRPLQKDVKADIKTSLQQVAQFVREHPDIKAIAGSSWLMSHPLVERIGFKKVHTMGSGDDGEKENQFKQPGYWLQLVDEKGEIKEKVAEYLYKNHKLPYDFAYGKMDRGALLERYGGVGA